MCYYNGQKVTRAEYIRLKQLEKALANYDFLNCDLNVGFDYKHTAVLKPIPGKEDFDIVEMEWGFRPHFIYDEESMMKMRTGGMNAKTGKYDPPIIMLNAIGEEMFEKVSYKKAAIDKRCLILSSGFYEWRHIFPANKRTGLPVKTAIKYPYHIGVKDKEYFYMAGIYSEWTNKSTGEYIESCAIVTTKANSLMEQVHNSKKRMPTILNEDLGYEWLFGELDQKRILEIAATQFPAEQMYAYPIAKDFLSALNPTEPFEYDKVILPDLVAA